MTALPNKHYTQWTPQGHRNRRRPKNTWKRDLEKEMDTAGFRYSCKKMDATAQNRAGCRQVPQSVAYAPPKASRHKSGKSVIIR